MKESEIPRLIVNADDFGWTDGHNLAVQRAGSNGVLNSASLMTTTNGFSQAVDICRQWPSLRVGVHLVLTDTASLAGSERLSILASEDGDFHRTIQTLIFFWLSGRLDVEAVQTEWRLQIERALEAELPVSHLDSHRHIHLIPPLFDAVVRLAKEYDVPYIRLPSERFTAGSFRRFPGWFGLVFLSHPARARLNEAGLLFPNHFHGFSLSGRMTPERLKKLIEAADRSHITEIMVHPAVVTAQVVDLVTRIPELRNYQFEAELAGLMKLRAGR